QALAVMAASLFILLACPGTGASTLSQKGDRLLCQAAEIRNAARAQVIVKLGGALTPAREAAIKALGADVYRHLPLLHLMALRIPVRNVERLAALPYVQRLSTDIRVKKCDEFTVGRSGAGAAAAQYGL